MSPQTASDESDPSPEIALQSPGHRTEVDLPELRRWLCQLIRAVAPGADSLAVRLTGDLDVQRLNREYRGRDATTDVLSFPGQPTPEGHHLGDIVVSLPAARRQAREAGHSLEREVKILLLHGVLHCRGYDHEVDDGTMEQLERRLRLEWIADE